MNFEPEEFVRCEYPKCQRRAVYEIFSQDEKDSILVCRECRRKVYYHLQTIGMFYPKAIEKKPSLLPQFDVKVTSNVAPKDHKDHIRDVEDLNTFLDQIGIIEKDIEEKEE